MATISTPPVANENPDNDPFGLDEFLNPRSPAITSADTDVFHEYYQQQQSSFEGPPRGEEEEAVPDTGSPAPFLRRLVFPSNWCQREGLNFGVRALKLLVAEAVHLLQYPRHQLIYFRLLKEDGSDLSVHVHVVKLVLNSDDSILRFTDGFHAGDWGHFHDEVDSFFKRSTDGLIFRPCFDIVDVQHGLEGETLYPMLRLRLRLRSVPLEGTDWGEDTLKFPLQGSGSVIEVKSQNQELMCFLEKKLESGSQLRLAHFNNEGEEVPVSGNQRPLVRRIILPRVWRLKDGLAVGQAALKTLVSAATSVSRQMPEYHLKLQTCSGSDFSAHVKMLKLVVNSNDKFLQFVNSSKSDRKKFYDELQAAFKTTDGRMLRPCFHVMDLLPASPSSTTLLMRIKYHKLPDSPVADWGADSLNIGLCGTEETLEVYSRDEALVSELKYTVEIGECVPKLIVVDGDDGGG